MKSKRILCILFPVLFFFSCEKEIDIEIEETDQKLVLNSWLKSGEAPSLKLFNSVFIFGNRNSNSEVTNASVKILENGTEVGALNYDADKKLYTNQSIIIQDFKAYELIVDHPKYGKTSAIDQMPEKNEAEDLRMNYINKVDENGYFDRYAAEIVFEIKDNPNEKNYYLAKLISYTEVYNPDNSEDTIVQKNTNYYWLEPSEGQGQYIYLSDGNVIVMNDDLFDGKRTKINMYSYNDLRAYEDVREDEDYYFKSYNVVELHQINEALYKYFITLESNQYPEVFTEPSQVFSNIKNGYGIMGLSSKHIFTIEEKKDNP